MGHGGRGQILERTMLPRQLLARSGRLRTASPRVFIAHHRATVFRPSLASSFHSSASRKSNEPLKSPFQTFVDVLKEELQKSRELQDGVKALQGDVDKLQDSETLKRARDMYERARVS